jgi:nickel transport protein
MRAGLCILVGLMAAVFPGALFGHGVEVFDLSPESGPVCAVVFHYSTGEPISYASVKLYPPSGRVQNGESLVSITDRNGVFSFVPDEAGEWRVDMEDGMGHKGSIVVNTGAVLDTSAAGKSPATTGARPPLVFNVALGLSLLLNVFGVWHFLGVISRQRKTRFQTAEAGHAYK